MVPMVDMRWAATHGSRSPSMSTWVLSHSKGASDRNGQSSCAKTGSAAYARLTQSALRPSVNAGLHSTEARAVHASEPTHAAQEKPLRFVSRLGAPLVRLRRAAARGARRSDLVHGPRPLGCIGQESNTCSDFGCVTARLCSIPAFRGSGRGSRFATATVRPFMKSASRIRIALDDRVLEDNTVPPPG
jgi:hypothetical protein